MTERKPCGRYHVLPCGLDVACPVPVRCFEPELSNEEINTEWLEE